MMDERKPLSCGDTLYLGGVPYRLIGDPVKQGNAIAYRASAPGLGLWKDVLIREYFPLGLQRSVCRKENGELVCEKAARELFEAKGAAFWKGEQAEAKYVSAFLHETGLKTACYHAHGTSYSVRILPQTITLEKFIKQNPGNVSLEKVLPWLLALLDYLEIVHRQGLLHLEIRPSQIYLLTDRAVFLDHVCFWEKGGPDPLDTSEFDWEALSYIAPEIRLQNAGDLCPATDLYSVALIFYRLVYGHRQQQTSLGQQGPMKPQPLSEQARWFRKNLHVLPRKRCATAAEFKAALLAAEDGLGRNKAGGSAACL